MADHRGNRNVIEIIGGDGLEDVPDMDQSIKIAKMPFKTLNSEELYNVPTDWKELVAADEGRASLVKPREEFPIPSLESSGFIAGTERPYRRHCKSFYSKRGCSYGDECPYVHDEEAKVRDTDAIILGPGFRVGVGDGGATRNGGPAAPLPLAPPPLAPPVVNLTLRPSNWRTRICYKWKQDGFCPFGSRCFFAHGAAELQRFGGGLVDNDGNPNRHLVAAPGPSVARGVAPAASYVATLGPSIGHAGGYEQQGTSQRPRGKWKGPDKISRIYGDWIDELE